MNIKLEVDRLNKIAAITEDQSEFWNAFFDLVESGQLMPNSKLVKNKEKAILWLLHAALPLNLKPKQPDQAGQRNKSESSDSGILIIRDLRVLEVKSTGFYHGSCVVEGRPAVFVFFRGAGLFLVSVMDGVVSSFFRMLININVEPIASGNSNGVH